MPISIDFSGKLVLLTGGGRGIGLGIARALAQGGADLAITYTSKDAHDVAKTLSSEFGVRCEAFKCDVAKSDEVDRTVQEVVEAFGRKVDIGVANAGISLWIDSHAMTDAELQNIFAVNAFGPYYLSRALMRSWLDLPVPVSGGGGGEVDIRKVERNRLKGKQLLFVSSISALVAMNPQHQSAYNASKGAVTMFSKSLAGEWAHTGVSVNTISPGYVETDMIANPTDERGKEYLREWVRRTPAPKMASADEVGNMVALMLSDQGNAGGWLTGSDVVFDGGYTVF